MQKYTEHAYTIRATQSLSWRLSIGSHEHRLERCPWSREASLQAFLQLIPQDPPEDPDGDWNHYEGPAGPS